MRPASYLQTVWACLFRRKEEPAPIGSFTVKERVPVDLDGISDDGLAPLLTGIDDAQGIEHPVVGPKINGAEVDRTIVNLENVIYWMNKLGHPVKADGSLNIVGLRMLPGIPDQFDDVLIDFSRDPSTGAWDFYMSLGTTDPGSYHLLNPSRVDGTFIMAPGHYPNCWKYGQHHAGTPEAYTALVQAAKRVFLGYRDRNKDGVPDRTGKLYDDCDGVNAHHAGVDSPKIVKWSAGCWVWKRLADYAVHMGFVDRHRARGHGDLFDATLIEWPPTIPQG